MTNYPRMVPRFHQVTPIDGRRTERQREQLNKNRKETRTLLKIGRNLVIVT